MYEIILPWPPSVNSYWRSVKGRVLISAKGRDYRQQVQQQVQIQGAALKLESPLKVEIQAYRPDRRIRDIDNLPKATLDAMTHAGVYLDDSQIHDLRIFWADELGAFMDTNGFLRVKIYVIQ